MKKIIEFKNIYKEYNGIEILKGINLDIYENELVVILGPSGAGKSTLLNLIGGIDSLSSGALLYNDNDISLYNNKQLTNYRAQELGFIFQSYNLLPMLNVYENIDVINDLQKKKGNVTDLLVQLNLANEANKYPSQLSGGQQQRTAIGRALIKQPKVLLCDEPTGALDTKSSINVLNILVDLKITRIIVTHNIDIAKIANRVIYVKDGMIDKVIINDKPLPVWMVNW